MKCMTQGDISVVEETVDSYELSTKELVKVMMLVEHRAMDTSLPFSAYNAAHTAAAKVVSERK